MAPLGVLRDSKSLSRILWIQIQENSKKKIRDCLADFYKW